MFCAALNADFVRLMPYRGRIVPYCERFSKLGRGVGA